MIVAIVLTGLVFGPAVVLLLKNGVLSRMVGLRAGFGGIGTSGNLSAPLQDSGTAELATLAVDINQMLHALERIEAERDRVQEAWAAQAEELARSNAELEQFAYVGSHDLQEPLRMVSGFLQLLERRYKGKLDSAADEYIAYAVDGANRMQALIDDLLAYSRVGSQGNVFEPTDCSLVLDQALFNLWRAIKDSEAVVTHDKLPTVRADGTQLLRVFQNLMDNAIRFRSDQPPVVHVGAQEQAGHWLFSVRDNGIGIDPQHSERVFRIFEHLHGKGKYPGTGIGLAICKKIVERHGGRIWMDSTSGQGSTFLFTIPRHEGGQT